MRTRSLLLTLAPAAAVAGCIGSPPSLTLTRAYVADRTDAGAVVNVVVHATNPTGDPLPMWAMVYSPGADAVPGPVERWAQATAPPGGAVEFELPVVMRPQADGRSTVTITGTVSYVPGGKLRELLSEIDVPLPSTGFSGSVPVDWAAPPPSPAKPPMRTGAVRTAVVTDRGPTRTFDTLPPLKPER
ncbi:MAG: hypothetical protein K2Q09_07865 [Phycisphaerales bacterium]|nr:hypothetical protein [Phycisphaerales bacterium]